jgi:hypothetical protein
METVGRWTAITVLTPVPAWWSAWLRLNFRRLERRRRRGRRSRIMGDLESLAFISYAHWGLVRLRSGRYLVFQSNFNGAAKQYVEAFARIITWGMRGLWAGATGVPGPLPVAPFEAYILDQRLPVDHYYCAYPEASTKMVLAALELRERHAELARRLPDLDDAAFASTVRDFLVRNQQLV